MKIIRSGTQASISPMPAKWFTGTVRYDPMLSVPEGSDLGFGHVTFEPKARTYWHTHPKGQALIVTFGCGRVAREGGKIEEIRQGDIVWFSAGEKHWHGAAPDCAMSHYCIQQEENGSPVEWLEPVSDAQYNGA